MYFQFHHVIALVTFYCSTSSSAVFNVASLASGEWTLGSPNRFLKTTDKQTVVSVSKTKISRNHCAQDYANKFLKWQAVADDNSVTVELCFCHVTAFIICFTLLFTSSLAVFMVASPVSAVVENEVYKNDDQKCIGLKGYHRASR